MTVEEWLGKDNQLGIDIWNKKYRYGNESFDEWLDRVSGGNPDIREAIALKRFLFGGRILANRGLYGKGQKLTYSNCYVVTPPEDSIESIFDCAKKLARTYSYGGGCGVDISKLAPRGAKIHNAAKTTSGAVSFMDLYSLVTGLIGQSGRRGALMISIDCSHPDLEEFIGVKADLGKVTSANISVKITDEFMQAVRDDKPFILSFTREETKETTQKTVMARELFKKLATMNWRTGEPGMLFWDRIKSHSMLSEYDTFEFAGTNPCAEEPLPAGGSCLLGAVNLAEFVHGGAFEFDKFETAVKHAVIALNEVLDEGLGLHPLGEQRDSVRNWRQIGLGIMGLADMLIKLGITYGSPEALKLCDRIGYDMINAAARASTELAEEHGSFPMFNAEKFSLSEFSRTNLTHTNYNKAIHCGMRNSQLLTIAPTGTISTMIGVSGGIEPIFANYYERRTQSLHGEDVLYKVFTPIVEDYMKSHGITDDWDLPEFFITARDIAVEDRIKMQAVWQTYIDASISSTVNLPESATVKDVEELYMKAWEAGLKGITVFRENCERAGILTTQNSAEKPDKSTQNPDEKAVKITQIPAEKCEVQYTVEDYFPRGYIEPVPDKLTYRKYRLQTGCGRLYLFVGIDEDDGRIYDCFTNTDGVGGCVVNTQANSRLMSACIRGGVPVEYVIEQLEKAGTCPSYQYARGKGRELAKGKSCPSAIANVLKSILQEFKELNEDCEEAVSVPDDNEDSANMSATEQQICPECGAAGVVHENGCNICKLCGWSKCG